MNRLKWFVAAVAMGALFFGCKGKEQTAEAPPPEKPKAEAPAPKAEEPKAADDDAAGATGDDLAADASTEAPVEGSEDAVVAEATADADADKA